MMRGTRIQGVVALGLALQAPASGQVVQASVVVDSSRPESSTFALGEAAALKIAMSGLHPGSSHRASMIIKDAADQVILTTSVAVVADTAGGASWDPAVPTGKLGYFSVHVQLEDGTTNAGLGTRVPGLMTYAVVPDPHKRLDYGPLLSRFGLQGGFNSKAVVEPYLGVRYFLNGHDWSTLEPREAGQFRKVDVESSLPAKPFSDPSELGSLKWDGAPWTMYPLGTVTSAALPVWAIKPGTTGTICKKFGALNDAGVAALGAFVKAQTRAFVATYPLAAPRVYQVTWEPSSGWCYGGTPEDLVKMYAVASAAIHSVDKDGLVAGPTLFINDKSTGQLDGLLAAGLGKYIDVLSIHPYVMKGPPEKSGFLSILRHQTHAVAQAAGHPVGLIGTEHGFESTKVGDREKAQYDIRTTLMMLGEGARFDFGFYVADYWSGSAVDKAQSFGFYYNLNPKFGFGTDKLSPKIVVPAYAAMTWFLDGSSTEGPVPGLSGTQIGYRFRRGGKIVDAVWDYDSRSQIPVNAGDRACGWMGNCAAVSHDGALPIGGDPLYIFRR